MPKDKKEKGEKVKLEPVRDSDKPKIKTVLQLDSVGTVKRALTKKEEIRKAIDLEKKRSKEKFEQPQETV